MACKPSRAPRSLERGKLLANTREARCSLVLPGTSAVTSPRGNQGGAIRFGTASAPAARHQESEGPSSYPAGAFSHWAGAASSQSL